MYRNLADSLGGDVIPRRSLTPRQLVVSRQVGPTGSGRGNSFWLARAAGRWHRSTWALLGYRVPEDADVGELCRRCMAARNSAMGATPAKIVRQFGPTTLSDQEAAAVYKEMDANGPDGGQP